MISQQAKPALFRVLYFSVFTLFITSCSKGFEAIQQSITGNKNQEISESSIRVFRADEFLHKQGSFARTLSVDVPSSLLVEMPASLLQQNYVFGGVITEVTAYDNEDLGGLKASDYPATLARLNLDETAGKLSILGCPKVCKETSAYKTLLNLEAIVSPDHADRIVVDFSGLSSELDIPTVDEVAKKLKTKVTMVEYNLHALIFEMTTDYQGKRPVLKDGEPVVENGKNVEEEFVFQMKTRWYLKLTSFFDPAFVSRVPVKEVGFFQNIYPEETEFDSADQRIHRFSLQQPIKYYLKNVPSEHRKAFADSLDDWNFKTYPTLKRKLIEYEFIEKTDPRYNQIVTGDIRYNVIEWDEKNVAGYGGLGPSYAHPVTGQTFSAVTWIQGPMIEKIYKAWFKVARDSTRDRNSERKFRDFLRSMNEKYGAKKLSRKKSHQGKFVIHSQRPELQDPLFAKNDFDLPPENMTYEQYMYGYFRDMVAHEVGHNLGLRHNFRGNLASDDSMKQGTVTRSIMEYLGRLFRHLDEVGPYDVMAINYGYLGLLPEHSNWFCTDDDQVDSDHPHHSAECSSSDATSDPVSYFEKRVEKVYDLIVKPADNKASIWEASDVQAVLKTSVEGLVTYIVSAPLSADDWTNFFGKQDRPESKFDVSGYLMKRLQSKVCPESLKSDLANKILAEDQEATRKKLRVLYESVRETIQEYKKPYPVFQPEQWSCLNL